MRARDLGGDDRGLAVVRDLLGQGFRRDHTLGVIGFADGLFELVLQFDLVIAFTLLEFLDWGKCYQYEERCCDCCVCVCGVRVNLLLRLCACLNFEGSFSFQHPLKGESDETGEAFCVELQGAFRFADPSQSTGGEEHGSDL